MDTSIANTIDRTWHWLAASQPCALRHALTLTRLSHGRAARATAAGARAVSLMPLLDARDWSGLLRLQEAMCQRLQAQQQDFAREWVAWLHNCARAGRANTMSKQLEQDVDLLGQWVMLWSRQMVDLATLQENFEVNAEYWLEDRLPPAAHRVT
ncbi:hypothetical protein [Cupriavidus sp. Marseille-Q8015]